MRFLVPLLLLCSCAAAAQEPPPDLLLDGGHCLVTARQDWLSLGHRRPAALELGSVADDKAYPGADLLYLVNYAISTHARGTVFVFLVKGKDPHRVLQLQYRVGFRQTVDGSQQISLEDPPLGGIGTADDMLAAIREIGFHTWTIPVDTLARHSADIECDLQPGIQ